MPLTKVRSFSCPNEISPKTYHNELYQNLKPWIVIKFGGTSVATVARWKVISTRVLELQSQFRLWIVISALSKVTNKLEEAVSQAVSGINHLEAYNWMVEKHLELALESGVAQEDEIDTFRQTSRIDTEETAISLLLNNLVQLRRLLDGIRLTEEASPRLRARIMAYGELLSTSIGIEILRHHGVSGIRVDARDLLHSENSHTTIDSNDNRYLQAHVSPRRDVHAANTAAGTFEVVLTQGFIASTPSGETCLLGRGGSDTSGALFAALLDARRLEIWTDVHGLFTSDPRYVPDALLINEINYREAQELAAMGAKVLHPRCIRPAQWANIPVHIHNSHDPHGEGTKILSSVAHSDTRIMAVVRRNEMTLLTLTAFDMCGASGFLSKVFSPFDNLGISVDLIATSQYSVSVTLDYIPGGVNGESFALLVEHLQLLGNVEIRNPCAVVSIVGRELRTCLHEIGSVLDVLKDKEVHLVSESSEDLNLSFVVDQDSADTIVSEMHQRLISNVSLSSKVFGSTWSNLLQQASSSTQT